MRSLIRALCLLAALGPLNAAAQIYTTSQVEVVLLGCEPEPQKIRVVTTNGLSFQLDKDGNVWRGDSGTTINAAQKYVGSARLSGLRTGCANSTAVSRPEPTRWAARWKFRCRQEQTWPSLTIGTPEELPITYVRLLPSVASDEVPCDERGSVPAAGMRDVASASEEIYLNLGSTPPRKPKDDYHILVARGAFGNRKIPLSGAPLVVKRDTVVSEFCFRRQRCSLNQNDIFDKFHLDRGFKTMTLKKVP